MTAKTLATGVTHRVPADMRKTLTASAKTRDAWNSLTPLARNEWICWATSVKKGETRKDHIKQIPDRLAKGQRRPCCWPGCPHR